MVLIDEADKLDLPALIVRIVEEIMGLNFFC